MKKTNKPKDQILARTGVIYGIVAVMAIAVFIRIIILQFVQSDKWAAMADKVVFRRHVDIAAVVISSLTTAASGQLSPVLHCLHGHPQLRHG